MKRPHGQVVGTAIVDSKLLCEIVQRIEGMAGIEAFPVLAMAALDFAVMAQGICRSLIMPGVGFLRRMSRMSFRSASVCWFGWL